MWAFLPDDRLPPTTTSRAPRSAAALLHSSIFGGLNFPSAQSLRAARLNGSRVLSCESAAGATLLRRLRVGADEGTLAERPGASSASWSL
eukprot:8045051-Pyramimonas_sp.AAC.1